MSNTTEKQPQDIDDYAKVLINLNAYYLGTIGENWSVAYGKGIYIAKGGSSKEEKSDYDTLSKDLLMTLLRPLGFIFFGALTLGFDLIRVAVNIIPALVGSENSKLGVSLACVVVDVAAILLGVACPFLRAANLISRLIATLRDPADELTLSESGDSPQNISFKR